MTLHERVAKRYGSHVVAQLIREYHQCNRGVSFKTLDECYEHQRTHSHAGGPDLLMEPALLDSQDEFDRHRAACEARRRRFDFESRPAHLWVWLAALIWLVVLL